MVQFELPVIALVCSAGGLDALIQVLAPLPARLPAAVLVLQHASPQAHSVLPELLDARTALPVFAAKDNDDLSSGVVLVAPPGHHLLVTVDATVAIIEAGRTPPYRPSADLLLTTLALAAGPRATAVILTGRGNDGATGATAVHHFGGVVIASNEATSTEYGMPQASIERDHIVDHEVTLDQIADLLTTLSGSA
jgi:two-component system chemotaxis response regulator CheB